MRRDRRVEGVLGEEALLDRVERALEESGRRHHHVVAGLDGRRGGVRVVGLDALLPHHPADVVPVRDEGAGVAPLAAQHFAEQPVVDGDRHAVGGLVAEHEGAASLACDPFERREEPGAELPVRDVRLAGVAPALRLGVAGEVLRGGEDRRRVLEPVALIAAHHRRAELADEERVLAERLVDAAPAEVAGDAQHGGEGPVDAGGRHLDGGGPRDLLDELRIPGGGHAELGREDRRPLPEGVAVDAVLADQERDAETRAVASARARGARAPARRAGSTRRACAAPGRRGRRVRRAAASDRSSPRGSSGRADRRSSHRRDASSRGRGRDGVVTSSPESSSRGARR